MINLSLILRKHALEEHVKTGVPIIEIMHSLVLRFKSGVVDYSPKENRCTICGSADTIINGTIGKDGMIERFHKCKFCGNSFRSMEPKQEKKSGVTPENLSQTIAKPHKNPHIKRRRG